MSDLNHDLPRAVKALQKLSPLRPTLGMVLGSGFDRALPPLDPAAELDFESVPGFHRTGVAGHSGKVVVGSAAGKPVLVVKGRIHYYEGHSMESVTFPVRVLAAYGISDLLLTNAAGGIRPSLRAGDLMAVTDHINFMGVNPLRGKPIAGLPQFVDLTRVYDPQLTQLLLKAARQCRVPLKKGVYLAVSGPSYETPAEIRAFGKLGADAIGMSTVPEAIVARQCGIRVAALSCITNLAAGRSAEPLSHSEVLEMAVKTGVRARNLLQAFVGRLR